MINKSAVGEAEKSSAQSDDLDKLEKQHAQLVTNLAKLNASLERDEKFQIEVSDGLCPIFSARCLNLQEGITLDEFLSGRSLDLRSQITDLEKQHQDLANKLGSAREGQKYQTALKSYLDRKTEIETEGAELNAKKSALEKQRNELAQLERQMSDAQIRLRSLADPSARIRVLEKELNRETELTAELKILHKELTRLEGENKTRADQLVEFKTFDEQWTRFIQERDATIGEHRIFIANEAEATAFETRKSELEDRKSRILEVSSEIESAEKALSAAGGDYDADRHKAERTELLITERRLAEIRATSDAVKKREEQLAADLEHFEKLRENLGQEFKEKERLESVSEATAFIRDTLKEAAPRVARNYVYHVSVEANQMFREITGNAERTLKWAEYYSIVLEDEGFERPFQSLSGGEQMAAALSVRLALLKQLTDIRIAFFDEPTTNMDAERRENLAQQISRITHFDQLFVISHDETFDSYVDQVLAI
ncbi:MAG: hypothetical protein ABIV48_10355 [Pyrinomonadaceae bacterium]